MPRSDVFWDKSAPEWEPEDREESQAERMRRLNKVAVESCKNLFEALTGKPSHIMPEKTNERD
jgi:hypothetical protein